MALLTSMLNATCINRGSNASNREYRSIILHDRAGDEAEEGEEGEERLLSVLSMVLVEGVPTLSPHSATITPTIALTSIRNHHPEAIPAMNELHP